MDAADRLKDPRQLIMVRELGHGAFGKVFLMQDPQDQLEYAVKTEGVDSPIPQLHYEFKVYRKLIGVTGIPIVYAYWIKDDTRYVAMQRLGQSFEKCLKRITQWDVMNWITPKALAVLEAIHNRGFIHRDIKPENLLTGPGGLAERELFLVDFGLCKKFRMETHGHIPYRAGKRLTGTIRYCSVHVMCGEEQSRRDDLESLGYVLIYLLKQALPWMQAAGKDKAEQNENIKTMKLKTSPEDLCQGLPAAFVQYFRHVRSLAFDQTPNYSLLRSFFKY